MIVEINRSDFFKELSSKRGHRPEKIKAAVSDNTSRFFKSGRALIFISGSQAIIFSRQYDADEMNSFLSFMGVSAVSGDTQKIKGKKTTFLVMRTNGLNKGLSENGDILSSAKILCDAFNMDINFFYPDLCAKINGGKAFLVSDENSAAVVQISQFGSLLSAVAVRKDSRHKGNGKRIVQKAVLASCKELYLICPHNLQGFYESNGFKVFGQTEQTEITGENKNGLF